MYKLLTVLIFLMAVCCDIWAAPDLDQNTLVGTISDGKNVLPFATVQLTGTGLGDIADSEGKFLVENIPSGTYSLKIRLVGYQTIEREVKIDDGATLQFDFVLLVDRLNLNEVVVSASRYAMDRREAPVIVSVLNRKLFNATQSMALSEGLGYQPGVRVETNCQNCGFTQVRLNGLEGAYTQILVNSRPIFSALNGVYGLDQIPASILDRVEVVRSGGSALYGSSAIAGTINIITREPVENLWEVSNNIALIDGQAVDHALNFNGSLVSEDLKKGATIYGMGRDRQSYDANGDRFTEITNLRNRMIGAKAFWKPSDQDKISVDFNAIEEYRRGGDQLHLKPHFTDVTEELTHKTLNGGITYDHFSKDYRDKFSTYVSAQTTRRDSFYGGLGGGRTAADSLDALNAYGETKDLSIVAGVQYARTISPKHTIISGVERQIADVKDEIPGYSRVVDQNVKNTGVYSQLEWKINKKLKALTGARWDRTKVDGSYQLETFERSSKVETSVFSPRFTLLYDIAKGVQFRGGYARGFRVPQAFDEDLHISAVGGEPKFVILSNDLKTEYSNSLTASINLTKNHELGQTGILLEGFYTRLNDPFVAVGSGTTLENGSLIEEIRNGTGAFVRGVNAEISHAASANWMIQFGATAQASIYGKAQVLFEPDVIDEDNDVVSTSRFLRTPNLYGYFTSNWSPLEDFTVNLSGTYTGSMTIPKVTNASGMMDLRETPDFMEFNCKFSYDLHVGESHHLILSTGVQNVLNSYQDDFESGPTRDSTYIYGPSRPRTFFVGLKIGNL